MDSPIPSSSSPTHTYATRIRQNITIKPSVRLRQSPDPLPPTHRAGPRKIKPIQPKAPDTPQNPTPNANTSTFPPPHVFLHPDDANSKVFLAIARAFLSVDNRAMTIKDLAEMTVRHGLACQNVSAASQAITTYIRTHLSRCEVQQDHPLLLRHTLSGTPADDDLFPALYSHSGGAHATPSVKDSKAPEDSSHPPPEDAPARMTNFRKGTTVWYLSGATGAPCPFTRAGIRLCDYIESSREARREQRAEGKRRRERHRERESKRIAAKHDDLTSTHGQWQCGQKRKRSLGHAEPRLMSESPSSSDDESSTDDEAEAPPPSRPRLTLRLKPLAAVSASMATAVPVPEPSPASPPSSQPVIDLSGDTDSDDVAIPDSPSHEASFSPLHTAKHGDSFSSGSSSGAEASMESNDPSRAASMPASDSFTSASSFRRSPSMTFSVASLPPESDAEDDYEMSMSPRLQTPSLQDEDEDIEDSFDFESSSEFDDDFSSPGPRSPSASFLFPSLPIASPSYSQPFVLKDEPRDVGSMLEAWDDFDHRNRLEAGAFAEDAGLVEVLGKAAAHVLEGSMPGSTQPVKTEDKVSWKWEHGDSSWDRLDGSHSSFSPGSHFSASPAASSSSAPIKKEEEEFIPLAPIPYDRSFSHPRLLDSATDGLGSPSLSPISAMSPDSSFAEEIFSPFGFLDDIADSESTVLPKESTITMKGRSVQPFDNTLRPSARSLADVFGTYHSSEGSPADHQPIAQSLSSLIETMRLSMESPPPPRESVKENLSISLPRSSVISEVPPPCMSPRDMDVRFWDGTRAPSLEDITSKNESAREDAMIKTCKPLDPEIWASKIEGVSVYKMRLGSETLLRRTDTDFVNLTPILNYSRSPCPVLSTIANATILSTGPKPLQGVWAPLASARSYVKDHPVPGPQHITDGVATFLSDALLKHFPLSFQRQVQRLRSTDGGKDGISFAVDFDGVMGSKGLDNGADCGARPQFTPITVTIPEQEPKETPLSASEREILQALCVNHVWEKSDGSRTSCPSSPFMDNFTVSVPQTPKTPSCKSNAPDARDRDAPTTIGAQRANRASADKPLRRSKRVAAAVAAEARVTRSKKRSARKRS